MDQHVTYHPVTEDMLRSYRYYISDEQGSRVAAQHCAAVGMDQAHTQRLLDLLPHFAAPGDFPFDQTHGFSIALTQGFFGPYFYVHGAQLSAISDAISLYIQPWQEAMPDWDAAGTAQNTVLSRYSSGVYIPPASITTFMSDAHATPELAQVLGTVFAADQLAVLWSALQYAHHTGAGLLEAASVIEPNPDDLAASACFTKFDNCDQASLQLHMTMYSSMNKTEPAIPPAPDLPVPRHLEDRATASTGTRLPTTPSLTERLREKRGET